MNICGIGLSAFPWLFCVKKECSFPLKKMVILIGIEAGQSEFLLLLKGIYKASFNKSNTVTTFSNRSPLEE